MYLVAGNYRRPGLRIAETLRVHPDSWRNTNKMMNASTSIICIIELLGKFFQDNCVPISSFRNLMKLGSLQVVIFQELNANGEN